MGTRESLYVIPDGCICMGDGLMGMPCPAATHAVLKERTGTRRPRLLDLFCSAGGCSVGYHRAGYDVVGVDIRPQPRYPFEFHQGDALTYPLEGFDAIHASPPCQAYAQAALSQRNAGKVYPDLIVPVRERLEKSGLPFVIENVIDAPLQNAIMLCGSMFGLRVWRHRLFETTLKHWPLLHPCNHTGLGICVVGHGTPSWIRQKNGGKCVGIAEMRAAMGIDWMNRDELSQAIPPAYTEFIGRLLLDSNDCGRFHTNYQDLWFSPSELKKAWEAGRFRWDVCNWTLRTSEDRRRTLVAERDAAMREVARLERLIEDLRR